MRVVREETYTFTPDNGEPEVHIRSGRLRKVLRATAMDMVQLLVFPSDSLEHMVEHNGVELDRIASMTPTEAEDPVIVGLWSDKTHILIDGAHRRYYWALEGVYALKGWVLPYDVWMRFTFDPNDPAILVHHDDGAQLPHRRR